MIGEIGSLAIALECARRLRAGEPFWLCSAEVDGPADAGATSALLAGVRQAAPATAARWAAEAGAGRVLLLSERPLERGAVAGSLGDAFPFKLGQVFCAPGTFAEPLEACRAARLDGLRTKEEAVMKKGSDGRSWGAAWAFAALLGFVYFTSACAGPERRVHQGAVDAVIDQDQVRRSYIEAIGIGAADPKLPTDTQRKALARDAAVVKAQYELLSLVKGVELEGGLTVERAIETGSVLETHLKEALRGAEVLSSEFTADNGCVVTMRLPRARLERMMEVRFK